MTNFNIKNSTIGQVNDSGDNIQLTGATPTRKTFWTRLFTYYGLIGTTAGIIGGLLSWYAAHAKYGIWFFGLK